ncbi:hypothetical protein [Pseudoalteromonas sp. MSK9-3]|uniref:hypothetical protein n=1 Tax=Pseudoalteromonas sp. MSK9-3 TaxID=1897633 RepID=UPI001602A1DD|nr:hypothetical protein [Pseudoalteromonas sp. MSK9-3]
MNKALAATYCTMVPATDRQFEHCIRFSLANFHDTILWRDAISELAEIIALQLK